MKKQLILSLIIYQIVEWSIFLLISSAFPVHFWNVFLALVGVDIILTMIVFPDRVQNFILLLKDKE